MKINREEMLKKLKKDENLVLYNEFYDFQGRPNIKRGYQLLQGWMAEHVSKNNEYFYVVKGGFATEYMYKKVFINE